MAGFELPPAGRYGVGVCFFPVDPERRAKLEELLEHTVRNEGQEFLGWRDVPVDEAHVGETANRSRPYVKQAFVGAGEGFRDDRDAFERKLYVIRRIVELGAGPDFYAPSFSSRTIVYKGMLISYQLRGFYPDLADERFASGMALVHSRFSTNTFPSWELAHPYRVIAHNGEINTLMGNVNWMRARESQLASELFGDDLEKAMADRAAGRLGLGDVRQRPRAADARRAVAAARGDDDDPGGLRRPRRPPAVPQGLLRVPLVSHGAVGTGRRGLLHQRRPRRRDPGPQRPAPRPLV